MTAVLAAAGGGRAEQQGTCTSLGEAWGGEAVAFHGAPEPEPTLFGLAVTNSALGEYPGGPVFVTGRDSVAGMPSMPSTRVVTRRVDHDGTIAWTTYSAWPGATECYGITIAVDQPEGFFTRVFVAGVLKKTTGLDIYTIAYDAADGTVLWERRYNNDAVDGTDYPVKIMRFGDYVYVAGNSAGATPTGSSTGLDYIVLKYDLNDGTDAWSAPFRYNHTSNGPDVLADMAIPFFGEGPLILYVTGTSYDATEKNDFLTIRIPDLNPAGYTARREPSPATGSNDVAVSLAAEGPGVFVTGYTNGVTPGNDDYYTVAYPYDLSSTIWTAPYDKADGSDQAVKIGYWNYIVFVTGTSWGGSSTNYDVATIAYDATDGSEVWVPRDRRFDNAPTSLDDRAADMIVDKFGNLYICGKTSVGATHDILGLSYKADGALRWVLPPSYTQYTFIQYDGTAGGEDRGAAIRVTYEGPIDHDGEVFILGVVTNVVGNSAVMQYGVLKFTQTDVFFCP